MSYTRPFDTDSRVIQTTSTQDELMEGVRRFANAPNASQDAICRKLSYFLSRICPDPRYKHTGMRQGQHNVWLKRGVDILLETIEEKLSEYKVTTSEAFYRSRLDILEDAMMVQSAVLKNDPFEVALDAVPKTIETNMKLRRRTRFTTIKSSLDSKLADQLEKTHDALKRIEAQVATMKKKLTDLQEMEVQIQDDTLDPNSPKAWKALAALEKKATYMSNKQW